MHFLRTPGENARSLIVWQKSGMFGNDPSCWNVWTLLSRDFILLELVALLIASPVAYYVLSRWLQRYEYRTGVPWSVFVWSGAGALVITMLTVSFQSPKAALTDPVKSLRAD